MIAISPFKDFKIIVGKSSEKFILSLPIDFQSKILESIDNLKIDEKYAELDIKKLSGYKNLFRIRVGDYRIVYLINKSDKILNIIIEHRKNIYAIIKRTPYFC